MPDGDEALKSRPVALERLRLLQRLDSMIDFSRAILQLEIVFALIFSPRSLTPTDFVILLEERRKAILEALRKLEAKGLVVKVGERAGEYLYSLGEKGKQYAEDLKKLLGLTDEVAVDSRVVARMSVPRRLQLVQDLVKAHHVYKAIVILAQAPRRTLRLEKLAREMGLSPDRARSYLDLFSKPPHRLFRKIVAPGGGTHYRLEEEGLKLYRRTPHQRLERNRVYKMLARLTGVYWPENLEARIVKIYAAILAGAILVSGLFLGYLAPALSLSLGAALLILLRSLLP